VLRPGDTLVVWRLDRLGRSLKHLIETVEHLDALGVGFQSLTSNSHFDQFSSTCWGCQTGTLNRLWVIVLK
jgi:DNA invertase Pin-like site-specific DNA recombinase